jgi:hypothetical protein
LTFETLESKRLMAGDLPAFSSDAGLYQVFSNYGQIGQVNLETRTFETAEFSAGTKVNAAGFRPADNFAYGVVVDSSQIARIGSNGAIEVLGTVEDLPVNRGTYFVGDFANDDLLYLRNSGEKSKLYGVNVDTLKIENVIQTSEELSNVFDIAFNHQDEKFYASRRGPENLLLSIDLNGQVDIIGNNGLQKLTFGAMYADADGSVFGGANQTGDVYRFDLSTGAATLVGKGPVSGSNDGFSNATVVLEMTPVANDDSFSIQGSSTSEGNLFADTGSGSDVDGNLDTFFVSAVNGDQASVGNEIALESGSSLQVSENGDFTYRPSSELLFQEVGESTTDSFQYTITDDTGRSATATASITVEGIIEADGLGEIRVMGLNSFGGDQYAWLTDVGDVNGDGFADGAVGLPGADGNRGATFVVFGSSAGIAEDFNVNDLRSINGNDGSRGSIFYGINNNDLSGYSLSAAGDANGDGIGDLLISAKDADANGVTNSGQTYLVYGSSSGFGNAEINLGDLLAVNGGDGSLGMVINGIGMYDLSGEVLTAVGDINADGIDDFAIGAQHADADAGRKNSGQTYVIYGSTTNARAELDLSTMDTNDGFVINGVRKHDLAGGRVEGGTDVNGDGIDDLLVTAANADANGLVDSGQAYVIFGSATGFDSKIELAELVNGTFDRGTVIHGDHRGQQDGSYVGMISDTNGDGIGEIVYGQGNANATYSGIINGGAEVFADEIFLSDFDPSSIWLDNFETANDFDERSWDTFTYSATLYSDSGCRVTIWGDPHVEIEYDGKVERFDIGYGAGAVTLVGGVQIHWDTFEPDDPRFPLGPPLRMFAIISPEGEELRLDTSDGVDSINNATSLTNAQLRDFANKLRELQGDASKPLGT